MYTFLSLLLYEGMKVKIDVIGETLARYIGTYS